MADIQSTLVFGDDDPESLACSAEGPTFGIRRDPVSGLGSGIYRIVCIPTGKIYVGSAVNIANRWCRHIRELCGLGKRSHHSQRLQNAWAKYGPAAFAFKVIEWVEVERLIEREQYHIDANRSASRSHGFNMSPTAGSRLGVVQGPMSEEHRRKHSVAATGRKLSEEAKQKISKVHVGRKLTEEHKRKVSEAGRGRKHTAETRRKMSEAQVGKKKNRGPASEEALRKMQEANVGRKHTEETKQKMREASSGRTHTEEARRKIREARARQVITEEARRKMSAAAKGRKRSEEHQRKLNEAYRRRAAENKAKAQTASGLN